MIILVCSFAIPLGHPIQEFVLDIIKAYRERRPGDIGAIGVATEHALPAPRPTHPEAASTHLGKTLL